MAGKLFGRAFIRVNGSTMPTIAGTGKINLGGIERTAVNGDFGFLGSTEKTVNGEVECDVAVDAALDLQALGNTVEATITFECDSGQAFVLRNAVLAAPIELQSGDGKATLRFIGSAAESSL